jgi:uncharacterized protein (DUF169 family)
LYRDLADQFTSLLQVKHMPIGLAFVDTIPENVQRVAKRVPSACTFWRLAERGVFYASAEDHQECPVGMMTMGFAMSETVQQRAQELVETMASVRYFSPAEISALPVVRQPHQHIIYGRLDQFPVAADVILCILDTQQAMLIAETSGQANWLQGGQSTFGRPTCGVIPRTMQSGEASISFGCVGARTYVELAPSEVVLTFPAGRLSELVARLHTVVAANKALAPYHQQQKATFSA